MNRRIVTAALLTSVVAISAFALWARVVPANQWVFQHEETRLLGADAYYHLRHVRYIAEHFPQIQRWDVATHYPEGQRAFTPGLYDVGMAAAAWVVDMGRPSEATIRAVLAWTPPLLAMITLVALFFVVRRFTDAATGLLAMIALSLYPGGFLLRTLLGFSDHHVAEALVLLLLIGGLAATLAPSPEGVSRRRLWARAALHASPMAALIFTWRGSPVYLTAAGAATFLTVVVEIARGSVDLELARRILRFGVALVAMVLVVALVFPGLIMDHYLLRLGLIVCLGLAVVPAAYLWLAQRLVDWGWSRWAILGATVGVIAVGLFVALSTSSTARRIVRVLTEPKIPWVREHRVVGFERFWRSVGVPGLLATVAPVLVVWDTWKSDRKIANRFIPIVAGVLLLLWKLSHDYEYVMPLMAALGASVGLRSLFDRLAGPRAFTYRVFAMGTLMAALLLPIWGFKLYRPPHATPPLVQGLIVLTPAWQRVTDWLREHTPPPSIPVDAQVAPFDEDFTFPDHSYGVINSWDYGNFISTLGERATVASQEVSSRVAKWMWLREELKALMFWRVAMEPSERIRYVIIDAKSMSDHLASLIGKSGRNPARFVEVTGEPRLPVYNERYHESIAARLFHDAGRDLSFHRLVYQTPDRAFLFYRAMRTGTTGDGEPRWAMRLRSEPLAFPGVREQYLELAERGLIQTGDGFRYGPTVRPSVRVYEIVRGATITGLASPGATVEAQLPLRSNSDEVEWVYTRAAEVDASGRFEITVPYSTEPVPISDVQATGLYRFFVHGGPHAEPRLVARIGVPETHVQSGERLDLGDVEARLQP